jgi:3-oxoadipate enol-lactonase
MPLVRAGEVRLSYERGGSGEPLLLIMGMSGTFDHWGEPFLGVLRRRFDVTVYDHRGVGASTRVSEPFTIADLARDASALLDALELPHAHVLGFSMGGMVAQELALARPHAVCGLVLASTYCGGLHSHPARRQTLRKLADAMASGDRDVAVRASWEVNVAPRFVDDAPAYGRFVEIASRRRVAMPVIVEQMRAIAAHDTSERLGAIEAPTLVLHGSADGMVPVQNAPLIADLVPGARLEILEGAGHLSFWEEPQRVAELVAGHLAHAARKLAGRADRPSLGPRL